MTTYYSVNAEDDLKEKLAAVKQQLAHLTREVKRYEHMHKVHYGHVGDLGFVEEKLTEAVDFLAMSTN